MNYSPELVHRITSDASAWQCIDCKACIICNDSGDPVSFSLKFDNPHLHVSVPLPTSMSVVE